MGLFSDQNQKRIVLALQSGLKSDLTWALNTLTVLSFKEKDEIRKDATPLAKIPGLLDALLQIVCYLMRHSCFLSGIAILSLQVFLEPYISVLQIDDWRDIALPKDLAKNRRVRLLGANAIVTGFGSEYEALASSENYSQSMYVILS